MDLHRADIPGKPALKFLIIDLQIFKMARAEIH